MALINNIYVFVKNEVLTREADITTHSVPTGGITDNVRAKNPKLELTGAIVDVESNKADTIVSALEALYNKRSIITYQGCHIFDSAVIKSLETTASAECAGGFAFTMELEQLKISPKPFAQTKSVAATGSAQVSSESTEKYHVVKSGDTLYTIAQQYYGDSNRFIDIYNANKDVVPSDYTLTVGQRLLIP